MVISGTTRLCMDVQPDQRLYKHARARSRPRRMASTGTATISKMAGTTQASCCTRTVTEKNPYQRGQVPSTMPADPSWLCTPSAWWGRATDRTGVPLFCLWQIFPQPISVVSSRLQGPRESQPMETAPRGQRMQSVCPSVSIQQQTSTPFTELHRMRKDSVQFATVDATTTGLWQHSSDHTGQEYCTRNMETHGCTYRASQTRVGYDRTGARFPQMVHYQKLVPRRHPWWDHTTTEVPCNLWQGDWRGATGVRVRHWGCGAETSDGWGLRHTHTHITATTGHHNQKENYHGLCASLGEHQHGHGIGSTSSPYKIQVCVAPICRSPTWSWCTFPFGPCESPWRNHYLGGFARHSALQAIWRPSPS